MAKTASILEVGRPLGELNPGEMASKAYLNATGLTLGSIMIAATDGIGDRSSWQGSFRGNDDGMFEPVAPRPAADFPVEPMVPRPRLEWGQMVGSGRSMVFGNPFAVDNSSPTAHFRLIEAGTHHAFSRIEQPEDGGDEWVGSNSDDHQDEAKTLCGCSNVWIARFTEKVDPSKPNGDPPRDSKNISKEERKDGWREPTSEESKKAKEKDQEEGGSRNVSSLWKIPTDRHVRGTVSEDGTRNGFDIEIEVTAGNDSYSWEVIIECKSSSPVVRPLVGRVQGGGKINSKKTGQGLSISGTSKCPTPTRVQLVPSTGSGESRPPELGDTILIVVLVNGERCGFFYLRYTNSEMTTGEPYLVPPAEILTGTAADNALKNLFKTLGLDAARISRTQDVSEKCKVCKRVAYTKGFTFRPGSYRSAAKEVTEQLRKAIESGEISQTGPSGRYKGRMKISDKEVVDVNLQLATTASKDAIIDSRSTENVRDLCPPPAFFVAIAGDGATESREGGVAEATAPWTGCAVAIAGNGFSLWNLSENDQHLVESSAVDGDQPKWVEKAGRDYVEKSSEFKGPESGKSASLGELKDPGGNGGAAIALGGTAIALGGNGGNGRSTSGIGGYADVSDRAAPDCCMGAGFGIAVGGTGGSSCNGNGANGGDAGFKSAHDEAKKIGAVAAKKGKWNCGSPKFAVGGNGGLGIKKVKDANGNWVKGNAKGGNGGNAHGSDSGQERDKSTADVKDWPIVGGRGGAGMSETHGARTGENSPSQQGGGGNGGNATSKDSFPHGNRPADIPKRVSGPGGEGVTGETSGRTGSANGSGNRNPNTLSAGEVEALLLYACPE